MKKRVYWEREKNISKYFFYTFGFVNQATVLPTLKINLKLYIWWESSLIPMSLLRACPHPTPDHKVGHFMSPRKSVSKERKGRQLASGLLDLATQMVSPSLMTLIQCVFVFSFLFLPAFALQNQQGHGREMPINAQKPAKRAFSSTDKMH